VSFTVLAQVTAELSTEAKASSSPKLGMKVDVVTDDNGYWKIAL
jgi:hypothetical protein